MMRAGDHSQSTAPKRAGRSALLIAIAFSLMWLSTQARAASLIDVEISDQAGDALVTLTFDAPVSEPAAVALASPARLVLDFDGADSQLVTAPPARAGAGIEHVGVSDAGDRLRVTLMLSRPMAWQLAPGGEVLQVALGEASPVARTTRRESFLDRVAATSPSGAASTGLSPPATNPADMRSTGRLSGTAGSGGEASTGVSAVDGSAASAGVTSRGSGPAVSDIDYRATSGGGGELRVRFDRDGVSPQLETEGSRATLRFTGVRLPEQWRRILDLSDFATPLDRVTPSQQGGDTLMTLAYDPGAVVSAAQRGREVVVNIAPASSEAAATQREQFPFGGQRISLNFQNIDVRSVLSILAEEVGLNLVVSDSVSGDITLNLQQVPWDQALELILQSRGLASRRSGNVLMVAPGEELSDMAQRLARAEQSFAGSEALTTDYIRMRYARAADLALLLRGENGLGLLSERGHVSVDERTNTLLVQDTRAHIEEVRRTIDQLDVPVRQVQIEARIVIARERVASELGVGWGAASTNQVDVDNRSVTDSSSGRGRAYGGLALDYGSSDAPSSLFGIGYLTGDVLLDLTLNALESEGKSQTISQPRIITANQRTARIEQGQEIPYQEGGDEALTGTSIEFKEAVLALEVTPQITPDNRIIMDLNIQNDDVSSTQYNGAPAIDTNTIQTQVLVNNGETVVLGGILSSEQVTNLFKTPFLGDLPGLGRLFRYTEQSNEKVELLVFITPRILEDTLTVR